MVTKKFSGRPSTQASAASPAVASSVQSSNNSAILRSAFAPSSFQLALFASVIQGLDSQHLRIHDTLTGRLRCEHVLPSNTTVNSLDWGFLGGNDADNQTPKKKRKRETMANGAVTGDAAGVVVAFGTSDSNICFFSAAEGKIIGKLPVVHSQGIRDFKFTNRREAAEAWSLGGEGKLVQWDLRKRQALNTFTLPTNAAITLARPVPTNPSVICASHTAYVINPDTVGTEEQPTFTGSTNPIHSLITSLPSASHLPKAFLAAAESDRFMNVFDRESQKLVGSLVSDSDVQTVALFSEEADDNDEDTSGKSNEQVLAAVTRDGLVEIFPQPFDNFQNSQSTSLKSKRRQMTRKAEASLKITRPDKSATPVPAVNASFEANSLVVAWVDGSINLVFERIPWRDENSGALLLKGQKEIIRGKSTTVGATVMNGAKDMGKSKVDESRTVVVERGHGAEDEQKELAELSSGEDEESEAESAGASETAQADVEMKDGDSDEEEEGDEAAEPSFGDLIRASGSDMVDVEHALDDGKVTSRSLVPSQRKLQPPSGTSLGTILTQSLKTNDVALLESCFHTTEFNTIRSTIERLDSALAASLLQKLAERLHNRPGRAGSLMVWVQWTLISHGGYLAGQPELMKKLGALNRVIKERASGLQPLLTLKGKLDMLEAQMQLRKSMQASIRPAEAEDEDEEENVIYVEGEEDEDSEGGADEADDMDEDFSGSEDNDEDMPTTVNGVDEDDESGDDEEDEGFIDDEAEETDADTGEELSEDEVDHDDVDSDEEESDVGAPTPKRPAGASRRR
ncbi:NUC189-domain-containing protein [Xylona heveae TC161]|uniref:NUC189-domain-containing protein n=1 Tax=Xylona heveae (strain CBS 132557 / TC161) TaxID=1328760 RepID=A0A165A3Y2_XYLHT|nr:NUC189-domain-containing protein [Xylona heveae TC161]KZF19918.1 NUC189-domain-containing protein [Xylona heveae TC161]